MISVSGALVITRSGSEARLGADFRKQIFGSPQPLLLASGVLIVLACLPGMPGIPFLLLGLGLGAGGWRMRARPAAKGQAPSAAKPARENLEGLLKVEPLAIEVGLGLVKMVEGAQNSPLLKRISGIRRQLAADLGYLLPPVRVSDNLALRAREYTISLKGAEIARYELPQGCQLAIPSGRNPAALEGTPTREPAFGLAAWWIPDQRAEQARAAGYTLVDAVSVLGTHIAELARRYAHELFSRQDAKKVLDLVAVEQPKVVEDLVPKQLPLSAVQRVLQNLLRERVSIRDTGSILEALGEAALSTRNLVLLTEYARQAIRRTVAKRYLDASGNLPAYFLDASIEQAVESAVQHTEQNSHLSMAPQTIREILDRIQRKVGSPEGPVAAVTTAGARYFLQQMVEPVLPNLFFLSHNEIPAGVKVVSLGVVQ
jgi:flagellar biosynthesis protein FlhA